MIRTVVALAYMLIWGIATIVILVKNGTVPPEYWTLPAVGLGGLLAALNSLTGRQKGKKEEEDPPPKEDVAKENA